jgi:glycine cleavage system aminomethyltransferase T
VFVFESQTPEIVDALVRAGALVILTGTQREGLSIRTAAGAVDVAAEGSVPISGKEATAWLEGVLEKKQILLPTTAWSESGGI